MYMYTNIAILLHDDRINNEYIIQKNIISLFIYSRGVINVLMMVGVPTKIKKKNSNDMFFEKKNCKRRMKIILLTLIILKPNTPCKSAIHLISSFSNYLL